MELNVLQQVIRTHADHIRFETAHISDHDLAAIVDVLKREADRHWFINANRSLELAEQIIAIGQERDCPAYIALGTMARGDALQFLGRVHDAWAALDEAGQLYLAIDDRLGWARTRIGRLLLSIDMNCVPEATADAEQARIVFQQHANYHKQVTLDLNLGVVYYSLGNQHEALRYYNRALDTATPLPDAGAASSSLGSDIALIHNNIGISYDLLGDFHAALASYERALTLFITRQEHVGAALIEANIAHVAMAQGHYRQALQLLHQARERYQHEHHELDAAHASRDIVECYLALNRAGEAFELAEQVIASYQASGSTYFEGLTLLHAAAAAGALGRLEVAHTAVETAFERFTSLEAHGLLASARLRRAQIALRRGDAAHAREEAQIAASRFAADQRPVDAGQAYLVIGMAAYAAGDTQAARQAACAVREIARSCQHPELRYAAHVLLGRLARDTGQERRALRHFQAAVATIERLQRSLTITLRASFLEGSGEALRELLGLYLQRGDTRLAFETLERAKSQALLAYLADRDHLRWASASGRSRELLAELEQLRGEHRWFYTLAHERAPNEDGQLPTMTSEQALAELLMRERRMRAISEQLYLENEGVDAFKQIRAPGLHAIQASLDGDTTLLAFYCDGATLWAFVIRRDALDVRALPMPFDALLQHLRQLERNFSMALGNGMTGQAAAHLSRLGRTLLQRLHEGLLAPLADMLPDCSRLIVAPYGALHYLPFHLLFDGNAYMIERCEVVVVPAAGLLTRTPPSQPAGARILAHSWGGRLPHTRREADCVKNALGGTIYAERRARRSVLEQPPTSVLHVAAHGEQRIDQPDLSFIQLADAQLYTDDLLQYDLSYELVVLSACETGRAHIAGSDELIGLGRGFLYAGAGALLTSLWRVDDMTSARLMERFYSALRAGASKAAALRASQLHILARDPNLHPAFWGAFQLVGDARPLSGFPALLRSEGEHHARATATS